MTILWTYVYERNCKKDNWLTLFCVEIIIISIPSLLGGFRAPTLGSDNLNYYKVFQYASSLGLTDLLKSNVLDAELEHGFLILTWLLAQLGKDYFIFAFATSFLTFAIMFEGIKYFRNRYSMTIMVMVYLFVYYCVLYNYVRQGIALSVIFFAYRYIEKRNKLRFFLMVAMATSLHFSAIISIVIYIVFYLKDKIRFDKYVFMVITCITMLVIAGPSLIYNILIVLAGLDIRTETLLKYSRRFSYITGYSFVIVHMVRALPQLIVSTLFIKAIVGLDDQLKGYYILCWGQFFIMILGCAFEPFSRLSLYFNYSEIILLAAISKCQYKKLDRMLVNAGIMGYCFIYWMIFTVLNYYGFALPVYPYSVQIGNGDIMNFF